jgi:hypothetical protein
MSAFPFISHHLFVAAAVPGREVSLRTLDEELISDSVMKTVEMEHNEGLERLRWSGPVKISELGGGGR